MELPPPRSALEPARRCSGAAGISLFCPSPAAVSRRGGGPAQPLRAPARPPARPSPTRPSPARPSACRVPLSRAAMFKNADLPYFIDHVVDDERHGRRVLHAPRPMLVSMLNGGGTPAPPSLPLPTIPSGVKEGERYSYLASRSLASPLSLSFSFLTFVDKEKQVRNKLSAPVGDLIAFSKKYKDIFGLSLFTTMEILKFVAAYLDVEEWKPFLGEPLVAYALKLDNLYSARSR